MATAAQVVYDVANLPREVLHLLRRLPYRPQLSPVQSGDSGLLAARDRLSKYRSAHPKAFPEEVETLLIQEGLLDKLKLRMDKSAECFFLLAGC